MPKISGIQILVLFKIKGLRVEVAPSSGSFHFLRPRGVFLHWYGVLGVVSIWDAFGILDDVSINLITKV